MTSHCSDRSVDTDEQVRRFHESLPPLIPEDLLESERYWLGLQKFLEEKGYILRRRFREGWVPSWLRTDKYWRDCEDGQIYSKGSLMDATRISDGEQLMLKRGSRTRHPHEMPIARYLGSDPLLSDPRNHSVPIYEVLPVPEALQIQFSDENGDDLLVMPRFRPIDDPPFDTIGEAVDFFSQIFEGLQFLYSLNIAHRDCNSNNIMMDARPLYPDPWHPVEINRTLDFKKVKNGLKHFTRTERPVKYYFIDFGLSRRYKPEELPPMEGIILGGDKSPPEHNIPGVYYCDPFPTDVYSLGNMIRAKFIKRYRGFGFIRRLVMDMTAEDPTKRPTMDEVVERFEAIRKSLWSWKLRSRMVRRYEFPLVAPFRMGPHWVRRIRYIINRRPAIPNLAQ